MKENILIAYFVQKGKENDSACRKVADGIGEVLKAKGLGYALYPITPAENYPEERENFELATKIEREQRHRPELVNKYSGMKYVDKLVLVTPNWWDDMPMGVYTFLDTYDFDEKKIVPVVVHGGDGGAKVTEQLRDFLHKVWVLPTVEIADTAIETPEGKSAEEKAVVELFQPSVNK